MISSAIVIPEPPSPSPQHAADAEQQQRSPSPDSRSGTLKRRQSSISNFSESNANKRPRFDDHGSPPPSAMSPPSSRPQQSRKASLPSGVGAEEKKRGQRLFGALLGNLAPPKASSKASARAVSNGQSRATAANLAAKREEIEKRTQDRLRREREDREEETRRKREELDRVRRKEQKHWDQAGREVNWRNERAMAGFLKTTAKPVLYYKPWELTPEEEEQIKRQIEEVENAIKQEREDWAARKNEEPSDENMEESTDAKSQANGLRQSPSHHEEGSVPDASQKVASGNIAAGQEQDTAMGDSEDGPAHQNGNKNGDHPDQSNSVQEDELEDTPMQEHDERNQAPTEPQGGDEFSKTKTTVEEGSPPLQEKAKNEDDHGGEELVEGQEDDVIY